MLTIAIEQCLYRAHVEDRPVRQMFNDICRSLPGLLSVNRMKSAMPERKQTCINETPVILKH